MSTLQDFITLRTRLGLSAKAASKALGMHPNYIYRVERGEREYKHLFYLALLGTRMADLV